MVGDENGKGERGGQEENIPTKSVMEIVKTILKKNISHNPATPFSISFHYL